MNERTEFMCQFDDIFKCDEMISFGEHSTALFNALDETFRNWALEANGVEYRIPALIDGQILDKCGYFDIFPQHLTAAAVYKEDSYDKNKIKSNNEMNFKIVGKFFTPAACLHIYPMLQGQIIEEKTITTLARVYRYEEGMTCYNKVVTPTPKVL